MEYEAQALKSETLTEGSSAMNAPDPKVEAMCLKLWTIGVPNSGETTPDHEIAEQAAALIRELQSRVAEKDAEIERLTALLNTPEVEDWTKGAALEAAHQRERWGADHDEGKSPFDWFWLVGYLAQKAAASAVAGDVDKAKHHTISTGAALANWHLALSGTDTRMRPGIESSPVSRCYECCQANGSHADGCMSKGGE